MPGMREGQQEAAAEADAEAATKQGRRLLPEVRPVLPLGARLVTTNPMPQPTAPVPSGSMSLERKPQLGETIYSVIQAARAQAYHHLKRVTFEFNGRTMHVDPGETMTAIWARWEGVEMPAAAADPVSSRWTPEACQAAMGRLGTELQHADDEALLARFDEIAAGGWYTRPPLSVPETKRIAELARASVTLHRERDALQQRVAEYQPYYDAVREAHNGYKAEMNAALVASGQPPVPTPESPRAAISSLLEEAEKIGEYTERALAGMGDHPKPVDHGIAGLREIVQLLHDIDQDGVDLAGVGALCMNTALGALTAAGAEIPHGLAHGQWRPKHAQPKSASAARGILDTRELRIAVDELVSALRGLHDEQYGAPYEPRRGQWGNAMAESERVLAKYEPGVPLAAAAPPAEAAAIDPPKAAPPPEPPAEGE